MSSRLERRARKRTTAGFSLLEVLVSMVVLSLGLLGMVGLQAASLQSNRDAKLQSLAVQYARELAEIAASNAKDTRGITNAADNPFLMNFSTQQTASAIDCRTATCTALDFTKAQLAGWAARLSAVNGPDSLPGARVVVCFDAAPFSESTGLPTWDCTADGSQLVVKIGWAQHEIKDGKGVLNLATAEGVRPQVVLPIAQ